MKRCLRIEKFRNIGIDEPATLVLNHSLAEGVQGDLVILIGENNSGKSNVLDALMCLQRKAMDERDITNLEFSEEYRKPTLSFLNIDGEQEYCCTLSFKEPSISVSSSFRKSQALPLNANDALAVYNIIKQHWNIANKFREILQNPNSSKQEIDYAITEIIKCVKTCYTNKRSSPYNIVITNIKQKFPSLLETIYADEYENRNTEFKEKYGFSLIPSISCYQEKMIGDNEISCQPDAINPFMKKVLQDIGYKIEDVHSAYKAFQTQHNYAILGKLERELNKRVISISEKFNSIYKFKDEHYEFSFRIESSVISLTITKNGEPLTLNYQSTGFRWFFNLYFNLLANNDLKAGDIVIMDEPATHLHVRGQQELRKFLKDFTLKTGITIVLATHSPFLIDMNHLDELRIVKNINGRTVIENDFATINPDDSDTLSSVIDALTVQTHILCDPDKQLVFVEGITDYNAYIKFAIMLGEKYKNLCFLPVNGIGNTQEQQRVILKRIMEIGRKRDPILLVDGDKAGEAIKKLNKGNEDLFIISLHDIDPSFTEIEHLFAEEDLTQLGIKKSGGRIVKSSALSSNIKNYRSIEDFSDETIANFKKVLDYIIENCE